MTTKRNARKIALVTGMMVPIALLHFVTGSHYRGPFPAFVNGYLIDILLPFGFYFLLCLSQHSLLRHWYVKASLVFGAASAVEVAQMAGISLLGRTFDPVDIMMYGLGVSLAVILDTILFPAIFDFWTKDAVHDRAEESWMEIGRR